jgi:DNA-binding MarR family transcriptional regulator
MRKPPTPGQAVSDLILDLFRVNSLLIATGDRLVAGLRLTSARWQVLGAVVAAKRPQPVAWLARDLGAHRQNIQRIVNDLRRDGLLEFQPNPHHKRAPLVVLTDSGQSAFTAAMALQAPWIERVAEGLALEDIDAAQRVLSTLRGNLERNDAP